MAKAKVNKSKQKPRKKTQKKKQSKRKTQINVLNRRERVAAMLLKGFTYRQIAATVQVSLGMIAKDVDAIYDDVIKALKSKEGQTLIASTAEHYRGLEREAWSIFTLSESDTIKLRALGHLESIRGRLVNVLQSMNAITKAPDVLDITTRDTRKLELSWIKKEIPMQPYKTVDPPKPKVKKPGSKVK